MQFETIEFSVKNGLAQIRLNRPEQQNAINVQMVGELTRVFESIQDGDETVSAVVLRGAGDRFSRGIDLSDFPREGKPDVYGFSKWEQMIRLIERVCAVTIAAVDGPCAGGGLQLALACDARVATRRSTFSTHEVRMGFLPGMGTFRLAKFIGLGRARRMALSGRIVSAVEAENIGLIDWLCTRDDFETTVQSALEEFTASDPEAVLLARRLLDESFELSYEDFIGGFLAAQHRAIQSDAFKKAVTE